MVVDHGDLGNVKGLVTSLFGFKTTNVDLKYSFNKATTLCYVVVRVYLLIVLKKDEGRRLFSCLTTVGPGVSLTWTPFRCRSNSISSVKHVPFNPPQSIQRIRGTLDRINLLKRPSVPDKNQQTMDRYSVNLYNVSQGLTLSDYSLQEPPYLN